MAKHGKKVNSKADTQEIVKLEDFRETEAHAVYEEDEEDESGEQRLKKMKIPKAAYRVAVILLVLVLGLALWLNRENLAPENVVDWVKLQFMGASQGDGFPVPVTGSAVSASNFTAHGGNALVLSDTAFTMLDSSGKELVSLRHSLNEPAMRAAGNQTLLYNQGSTGYLVLSGTKTTVNAASERDILVGAVAHNGKFALGVQGADGASELDVYQKDGSLQFQYQFAKDYITAIALNYDGTYGAVCTVRMEKGEWVSKITVFDFNRADPETSYETRENLLLDAAWTESGDLYAVGDSALVLAGSSAFEFTEYGYEGRQLTAYRLDQGRAFLSISAYEHAGPSTLLIFRGQGEPVRVEAPERIVALSASGGSVGALLDGSLLFYDSSTGVELGRADTGGDAKSAALGSERMAYVLGVSEVRSVQID